MNSKNDFTGDRKIMNMRKVGTVLQFRKASQPDEKPVKSMGRAIHYAKFLYIQADPGGAKMLH